MFDVNRDSPMNEAGCLGKVHCSHKSVCNSTYHVIKKKLTLLGEQ